MWVGGGGRAGNNYQGLHANSKYLMSVFLICKPDFSEFEKLLQKKPDNTVIAQNHRQTYVQWDLWRSLVQPSVQSRTSVQIK